MTKTMKRRPVGLLAGLRQQAAIAYKKHIGISDDHRKQCIEDLFDVDSSKKLNADQLRQLIAFFNSGGRFRPGFTAQPKNHMGDAMPTHGQHTLLSDLLVILEYQGDETAALVSRQIGKRRSNLLLLSVEETRGCITALNKAYESRYGILYTLVPTWYGYGEAPHMGDPLPQAYLDSEHNLTRRNPSRVRNLKGRRKEIAKAYLDHIEEVGDDE